MKFEVGKDYKDNFGTWWNCVGVELIGPVKKYKFTTIKVNNTIYVVSYYSIHEDGTEIWDLLGNILGEWRVAPSVGKYYLYRVFEEKKECDMKICPTIFEEVKRQIELEYDLVKKKNPPILVRPNQMFKVGNFDSKFAVIFDKHNDHKLIQINSRNTIIDISSKFDMFFDSAMLEPAGYLITSKHKITIL